MSGAVSVTLDRPDQHRATLAAAERKRAQGVLVDLVEKGVPPLSLSWKEARELWAELGQALKHAPAEEVKQ